MARYQILNNIDHKDLRVRQERSAEMGDNLWFTATFPGEFRNLQNHYPIVFSKNPESGILQAVVLLGFKEGENLFLEEERWEAGYIPLNILRAPFLIGYQDQSEDGVTSKEMVVSVDMESPRVTLDGGEPLFLKHGGNTEFLEQVNSLLQTLAQGFERNQAFHDMLIGMDLLESFVLDVQLDDGSEHRMSGFYTINEPSLRGLTGDDLVILNNNGFLEPIYMAIASMSNLSAMVERKNRLLAMKGDDAEY